MDSQTMISVIHSVKDIALAAIAAAVFIYGILHSVPISTQTVEYVAIYAAYYGIHTSSVKAADKAMSKATGQAPVK